MGGSHSRLIGVGAGVEGREGAGVPGGAMGFLGIGTWVEGVFAIETRREESEADLSVAGALTEGLATVESLTC